MRRLFYLLVALLFPLGALAQQDGKAFKGHRKPEAKAAQKTQPAPSGKARNFKELPEQQKRHQKK